MEIRCRLCAEVYPNLLQIIEDSQFLSMINCLYQLRISLEDKLPSTVCQDCYTSVHKTWQFKEQIDKAQLILSELINTVNVLSTGVIHNGVLEVTIYQEDCKTEKYYEVQDVIEDTSAIQQEEVLKEIKNTTETEVPTKKVNKNVKKVKKLGNSSKKKSSPATESLEEIEYVNPDGSVVPKSGISGWDSYQWSCCHCSIIFQNADELREHFATIHNSTIARYVCADCAKVYSKYSTFISHVKVHRPFLKYCCDVCYKWYPTAKDVTVHQATHYEEWPYQCTTCGKKFRTPSVLMMHSRSHLPDEVKNCYSCDECPKKFGTKPNLMAHKRIHLGVKEYTCEQCGKSFVQKGNLDNHMLTHNSARPFNCSVCGKTFKTLLRLKKHNSVHSGLKPHSCDICGKQFRERGTLKEHHRIHTGAMPFTCEFCGKCFRFKGVLTTHRRQHTGERPYSCNECQHHFTNWPNYNKHMKRRHGINTSVNCRTKQDIPPTGKPHRNPPGTILAPPQPTMQVVPQTTAPPLETFQEPTGAPTFYPVLGLYTIPEDLLQQQRV